MEASDIPARLLLDCLVRITGERMTGSGFLAAPGLVVTCAHVVGRRRTVAVRHGTSEWVGEVRYASAPPGRNELWPYPDLAIVEIPAGAGPRACAWLDQRLPAMRSHLQVVGFSDVYQPELRQTSASPTFDGLHDLGGPMLMLGDREIPAGMSGGPVLNLATGGVCGVAKASRLKGAAMGGLAVPIWALRETDPAMYRRLIRAHDRFFAEEREWSAASDKLAPAKSHRLHQDEERQLRGILAGLPVPPDHQDRFVRAVGRECFAPQRRLVDSADVITELAVQLPPPRGELPYVLRYAADLARDLTGRDAQAIRDWVLLTAGRLRLGKEATARLADGAEFDGPSSLMVRIRPVGSDHARFEVRIWRYFDASAVIPVPLESTPLGMTEAIQLVRDELPRQLAAMAPDCGDITVELFLPPEQLEEDFESRPLWPEQPWSALGRKHAVLVRDQSRLDNDRIAPEWQKRWAAGAGRDLGADADQVACTDRRGHEAVEGWLAEDYRRCVLVFASSPFGSGNRPAVEVGLHSGVPVMMWRRGHCPDCPDDGCPGESFVRRLREALSGVGLAELPERVRRLRAQAAGTTSADHCGADLVLLYDDPSRRPPRDRLVRPEENNDD
ncbi:trypsin-like peptidase domain-containing protein [Actinoplanes subtropicus]|uniref:VMAP-C domain-containing protein n=1 Tax=Actinoplanes subtropicus TaxID=543632 RepID=UPI0004C38BAE|nr:trypsin-like peptidase domain-containing protein [Actinoplanes subtropicus]